jgi:ubiquinone/menaquinone biosynthesis C-methylase UbiE
MELDDIRRHWEEQGECFSVSEKVTPTSRDPFLGMLEELCVMKHLDPGFSVLEVGCGDALHTMKYADKVSFIHGLDVAKSLIRSARNRVETSKASNIELHVGSVLDLDDMFARESFHCVISQRCIINLPTWELQKKAIIKIHGVLKQGGLFIVTEGFQDELDNLNAVRTAAGLSTIQVVSYNRNLLHQEFEPFIKEYFDEEAIHDYGLYLFLSRVFHPLAVCPEAPKHDSRMNEVAGQLSMIMDSREFRKYSYNLCYILRKW